MSLNGILPVSCLLELKSTKQNVHWKHRSLIIHASDARVGGFLPPRPPKVQIC